jgi:hypothetical protein
LRSKLKALSSIIPEQPKTKNKKITLMGPSMSNPSTLHLAGTVNSSIRADLYTDKHSSLPILHSATYKGPHHDCVSSDLRNGSLLKALFLKLSS